MFRMDVSLPVVLKALEEAASKERKFPSIPWDGKRAGSRHHNEPAVTRAMSRRFAAKKAKMRARKVMMQHQRRA